MVSIKEALQKLKEDPHFQEWQKEHSESYLSHCLRMMNDEDGWNLGYYNKDDTVTTFIVSPLAISEEKADEIFKKEETKVLPLNMNDVQIDEVQAMEKAQELREKEYPQDQPMKSILILQNLSMGQVYNITFISMAMNTITVKVDSTSGEILDHKKTSLMDMSSIQK